jgi:hypothetical protein
MDGIRRLNFIFQAGTYGHVEITAATLFRCQGLAAV